MDRPLRIVRSTQALGIALRDERRRRGQTQAETASLAGLTQPTVSRVERGVVDVTLDTILRLAAVLDLDLALRDRVS